MLGQESGNKHFMVFGLILPGLKPMINHTQGEQANHGTTMRFTIMFGIGSSVSMINTTFTCLQHILVLNTNEQMEE